MIAGVREASAFDILDAALDVLEAQPVPSDYDPLTSHLIELRTRINRLELAFADGAAALDAMSIEDLGGVSAVSTLRSDCHMSSAQASASIAIGQQADRLPESCLALDSGEIGWSHLAHLAWTSEFAGDKFDEAWLVNRARREKLCTFVKTCRRYRIKIDPKRAADDDRSGREARFLNFSTDHDGNTWVRGYLDQESGAYIKKSIESLSGELPDDDRTPAQRRVDAWTEMAKLALNEGIAPERGGVRPHLQITASLPVLLGQPDAEPAELEGFGPISLEMLRRMVDDCSIRRLLLSEESLPIDVGRERRLFRGGARVALDARDKGCVWPGCTRPARHCQAHHKNPWWKGYPSDVGNGQLLCLYHHYLVTDGWSLIEATDPKTNENVLVAKPPPPDSDHMLWRLGLEYRWTRQRAGC